MVQVVYWRTERFEIRTVGVRGCAGSVPCPCCWCSSCPRTGRRPRRADPSVRPAAGGSGTSAPTELVDSVRGLPAHVPRCRRSGAARRCARARARRVRRRCGVLRARGRRARGTSRWSPTRPPASMTAPTNRSSRSPSTQPARRTWRFSMRRIGPSCTRARRRAAGRCRRSPARLPAIRSTTKRPSRWIETGTPHIAYRGAGNVAVRALDGQRLAD